MAVSKRLRYEILRRDNHTCRYCGQSAPDVKLTVDHVLAVALGGKDEASNLVAACQDCNTGKSSTGVSEQLVEDVKDDAIRHAAMITYAYEVLVEKLDQADEYGHNFACNYGYDHLPDDWEITVHRWHRMGVPVEIPIYACRLVWAKPSYWTEARRWRYLCGIVWNQIHAVDDLTAVKEQLEGSFWTDARIDELIVGVLKIGRGEAA